MSPEHLNVINNSPDDGVFTNSKCFIYAFPSVPIIAWLINEKLCAAYLVSGIVSLETYPYISTFNSIIFLSISLETSTYINVFSLDIVLN